MPFRQAAVVTGASVRTKTRQFSSTYVLVNTCDCLPNTSLSEVVPSCQCDGFWSRCGLKRLTTTFLSTPGSRPNQTYTATRRP